MTPGVGWRACIGGYQLQVLREPLRLHPGIGPSHLCTVTVLASDRLPNDLPLTFNLSGTVHVGRLASPSLSIVPPVPLEVGEVGARAAGPAIGCFSEQQLRYWAACSSDPWVVSWGYTLQFRRRPPSSGRVKMTLISNPAKNLALAQELSVLLAKGTIVPVDPLLQPGGFYSTYFLVKKKDSGLRPILDLRHLNRYLKVLPFHMMTTADTLSVIDQGEWFATVDLKDAYFHVLIAVHHQQYLRFAFQGRHY